MCVFFKGKIIYRNMKEDEPKLNIKYRNVHNLCFDFNGNTYLNFIFIFCPYCLYLIWHCLYYVNYVNFDCIKICGFVFLCENIYLVVRINRIYLCCDFVFKISGKIRLFTLIWNNKLFLGFVYFNKFKVDGYLTSRIIQFILKSLVTI